MAKTREMSSSTREWLNNELTPRQKAAKTLKGHQELVREAGYKMAAMGYKLTLYAFSLLPPITPQSDPKNRRIKFHYTDYCQASGSNETQKWQPAYGRKP
ncbi:MAG: hypothetical protein LBM77_02405 [Spirochaetaceae bacterium]|jgi:hypothetical protein|nr:hypothetical protein [Spirochaetaceae bacterium]